MVENVYSGRKKCGIDENSHREIETERGGDGYKHRKDESKRRSLKELKLCVRNNIGTNARAI